MMYEKIRAYLAQQLDIAVEDMDRDTTFESLHLDSLDMVEMIMDMEEELGMDFEMEGDMKLETIGDLADFIEEKMADVG